MLLFIYRSIGTVILLLLTVGIELRWRAESSRCSGIRADRTFHLRGQPAHSLAIAAGTDYGIFIIGRYQEARQAGEDPESAFYTMYRGTAHVILGSV